MIHSLRRNMFFECNNIKVLFIEFECLTLKTFVIDGFMAHFMDRLWLQNMTAFFERNSEIVQKVHPHTRA